MENSNEVQVLSQVISLLSSLEQEGRERVVRTISTFFEISGPPRSVGAAVGNVQVGQVPQSDFSADRTVSPKQFLLEKKPATDVERIACLAYYLTHYRSTPHFKTLDLSKLNTDAAQVKFANAAYSVNNALQSGYLVPASKGTKQLSAIGEQFVQALPDRDAAKAVMAHGRPRRRPKRGTPEAEGPEGGEQ